MDTREAHSFSGRLGLPLRHGLVPLRASLVRAVPAGWSEAQGSVAEEAEVLDAAGAPLQLLSQALYVTPHVDQSCCC